MKYNKIVFLFLKRPVTISFKLLSNRKLKAHQFSMIRKNFFWHFYELVIFTTPKQNEGANKISPILGSLSKQKLRCWLDEWPKFEWEPPETKTQQKPKVHRKQHWLLLPNNFSWHLFFRNLTWALLVVCCRAYKTIVEDDLKFPLIYGEGKKVRNKILCLM